MSKISELPKTASFETVIETTQFLLDQIASNALSDAAITKEICHILQLDKGPRGFFATILTDDRAFLETPSQAFLEAYRSVPDTTAELLVKNLAMSTAMVVMHRRNENLDLMASSTKVQRRSQHLIKTLQLTEIDRELEALKQSIDAPGEYTAFFDRWGYDTEQKNAIASAVVQVLR